MKLLALLAMGLALALLPQQAGAVAVGQTDTFQDLTTDGWFAGGVLGATPPTPPHVVATGGPDGAGDAFLEITAIGGIGPGSKITAINMTQWAGDYLAAGVGAIEMDLQNRGATDLTIRLQLEDPVGGPPADEAVTSFGLLLPASGDWTHVAFPISAADLTVLRGSATTLLGQVTALRIIQNPIPNESAPIAGLLGVDNITALAVPEPSSLALIASAALAALMVYRRRRTG